MKTIKPQKLGLLHRVFESDNRSYFVVSLFVFFPLDAPRNLLTEVALWKLVGEELGPDGILDEGLSKVQGELLVTGRCFVPGGDPRPVSYVRVKLGAVDKKLAVIGDRYWESGVPTEPLPFTEMPVDYARAFGGEGYALNPLGKGFAPIEGDAGEAHPMPNIEDPRRLITSRRDRPAPAGFGPYDLTWPQRFSKVGTYDEEWLKTRYPGVAKDMDPTFFNTAPEDQRIKGYFKGDEELVIENMHPEEPRIESRLPGVTARAFITQCTAAGEVFREIATRVDTVRLFPGAGRGVLVYRGMVEIAEDDAADVKHLIVACEDPAAPKTVEHYQRVLALRLDKAKGALAALSDKDLMPLLEGGRPAPAPRTDIDEMLTSENLWQKNLRRKQEETFAKNKAKLESMGMNPADFGLGELPAEEEIPGIDDVDALIEFVTKKEAEAAALQAANEEDKQRTEENARRLCAEKGIDYDKMMAEGTKEASGPPKFSAAGHLTMMRDMLAVARRGGAPMPDLEATVETPAYQQELLEQEERLKALYRMSAHYQPAVAALGPDESARLRAKAILAIESGVSFAGRDFTGADLSGLDLHGADLRGAFLEGVNFTGANLAGANLAGAVLAKANLTKANLTKANLGAARIHEADLAGADLTEAILARSELARSSFRGAVMTKADLLETVPGDADWSGVVAHSLTLLRTDLSRVKFAGADLTQSTFVEVNLAGADLSGVNLTTAQFVTAKGDGAIFRGATLRNVVFVHGSSLPGADFLGASLDAANLRGTNLERCRFDGATLAGADLSECDLREASFYRAVAPNAMLMKADLSGAAMISVNLMHGFLVKATLFGTDLTGANLFRADMAQVRVDGKTKLADTNMKNVRVEPRSRDGQS